MAIAPIETIQSNNSSAEQSSSGNETIDKNEFLLLFVTQLQNQDPLSPMENTELATQTAQFAQLEQLQNLNESMEYLQQYQSAIFDENAVSFIGKTIKAVDGTLDLNGGVPDGLHFDLERDANAVYVSIIDSTGIEVKEIVEDRPFTAGEQTLMWDGTDGNGNPLPDGTYFVEIRAEDAVGTFSGTPFIMDRVTAVNFSEGVAYLSVGEKEIPISRVQKVTEE